MLDRRTFLIAAIGTLLSTDQTLAFFHKRKEKKKKKAPAKKRAAPFRLDPKYEPQLVTYGGGNYPAGSIVVDPENRFLYFMEDETSATRYGVGVGRAGMSMRGTAYVARKAKWPTWSPTENMIRREPRYARYAGGMPGGPNNPLGARALYLYRGSTDTMYRIHGTNQPRSIGHAMSSGCIRMLNEHVEQLYEKVAVGTLVVILRPA
jgi:lipoprotein-anchoring transpeptidase ErfK/SrfK